MDESMLLRIENFASTNSKIFKLSISMLTKMFSTVIMSLNSKKKEIPSGRKKKLAIEDILTIYLKYLSRGRTFEDIGNDYGIHKATSYRYFMLVLNILHKSNFNFKNNDTEDESEVQDDVRIVDCMELEIRAKNSVHRKNYSGKSKSNVIKKTVIISQKSKLISHTGKTNGSMHDVKALREVKKNKN